MKRVIHIPVVHTLADLGSLGESVRPVISSVMGRRAGASGKGRSANFGATSAGPSRLCRSLGHRADLSGRIARLRQGRADRSRIGRRPAAPIINSCWSWSAGGRRWSARRTRSCCCGNITCSVAGWNRPAARAGRRQTLCEAADLLAVRDDFIARRIDATLASGETGLLFLGAAHRLDALSALGVVVERLSRKLSRFDEARRIGAPRACGARAISLAARRRRKREFPRCNLTHCANDLWFKHCEAGRPRNTLKKSSQGRRRKYSPGVRRQSTRFS